MTLPRTLGDLKNSPWAEPPLRGRTVRDEIRANLLARLAAGGPLFPGHRRLRGHDPAADRQRAPGAAPLHPARPPRPGQEPDPARAHRAARRADPDRRRERGERRPVRADLQVRPRAAGRVRRRHRRSPGSAATSATSRSWRRPTSPSPTSSATSTRSRPRAAGTCCRDELTMHFGLLPARQPRHLRHQRAARPERQGPGGPVQHHAGRRRPDQRLSGAAAAGRAARLHRQSRGLHRARQDHHAAQGPDRLARSSPTTRAPCSSAWRSRRRRRGPAAGGRPLDIPDFVLEVIERIAFEAREDKRVDKRSGVSQRLPISVLENAVSNAERRATLLGEERIVPRVSDVYAAVPSITGKLELEYEGELQGGDIDRARADPPRRGQGAGGADGRRRPRARSSPGSTRAARSRSRATSGPSSASRASAWCRACVDAVVEFGLSPRVGPPARRRRLRAGARGPRRPEADQPERGAGLHPDEAGAAGAGVWEGGDLVRVSDGEDGEDGRTERDSDARRSIHLSVLSVLLRPLRRLTTPAPSPSPPPPPSPRPARAPPVFSTMWKLHRVLPVPPVVLPVVARPHLVGVVQDRPRPAPRRTPSRAAATWIRKARGATSFTWSASRSRRQHRRRGPAHQHHPSPRRDLAPPPAR